MFPYPKDRPPLSGQFRIDFSVAKNIFLDFIQPELLSCFGLLKINRAFVPEAPVNKHNNAFSDKHNIRLSGQIVVNTVSSDTT